MQNQHIIELYRTLHGCIYQDNKRSLLILEWYGQRSVLKLPCYFSLRKLVNRINLAHILSNTDRAYDVEVLNPCGCDRCFVLNIHEILELQELVNGSKAMMELNSILHERLHRTLVCS